MKLGAAEFLRELLLNRPAVVVHEDLSRAKFKFTYGAANNNAMSNWARGVFAERLEFKAQERGSLLHAVNPAYSSQLCPVCGFVDSKNRSGDRFCCLHCKHSGSADQIAAINLLARASDPEITRWMPHPAVKALLLARFKEKRRLEASEAKASVATVSGQTPDVVAPATRRTRATAARSGERLKPHLDPATTRRANNAKPAQPGGAL